MSKSRLISRLAVALGLLAAFSVPSASAQVAPEPPSAPASQSGAVPDYYIVRLATGAANTTVARDHGLSPTFQYSNAFHGFAAYVPPGRVLALKKDPRVLSVVADQYVSIARPKCGTPKTPPCPTDTPTSAPTPTTAVDTPTAAFTHTPTATDTAAPTDTPTATNTAAASPTATGTSTATATNTATATSAATHTPTPTSTASNGQTAPTGVRRIDGLLSPSAKIDGIDERVNVNVAIIDTGVYAHSDLNVAGGVNCSTGRSYNDGNGHGTHVAGTVGALDNGFGVVGVAPGARLWAVRVLNNAGSGTWSSVICGVDWVAARAATIKVANMSLGGSGSSGSCTDGGLRQAICNAAAKGVTFVVAAGNASSDASGFVPANYDEVITVSALTDYDGRPGGLAEPTCRAGVDDTFASFSNFGAAIDIAAPGVCILSTWNNGGYNTISGTSMAAPHVSGAAALWIAAHPGAAPSEVKAALIAAWQPGPIPGDPDSFPEGIVNVGGF